MAIEFKASKEQLVEALNIVSAAASPKPVCAYMGCIHISAEEHIVTFEASNGALSIRHTISDFGELKDDNLRVDQTGECLISASYLMDAVKRLDSDIVSIATIDGYLTAIDGGNAKYRINGMSPRDFPKLSIPETAPLIIAAPRETVTDIFKRTAFAVAQKGIREVLTGVCVSADGNDALTACATDSYRMSRLTVHGGGDVKIEGTFTNAVIPTATLSALSNALKGDHIELRTDGTVLSAFDDNATAMSSVLLSGTYPDMQRLIPTEFVTEAQFSRAELAEAADRTLFIRTDSVSLITLDLTADKAVLTSESAEIGAYRQELAMKNFSGNPLTVSINSMYLVQAMKALHGDDVTLRFKGEMKPLVAEGSEGSDNVQLLLPVRTWSSAVKF